MAGKLLVVLIIVLLVGAVLWTWRRPSTRARAQPPRVAAMVACAHCGVHLPALESLELDGKHYCCAGHLESGPRSSS